MHSVHDFVQRSLIVVQQRNKNVIEEKRNGINSIDELLENANEQVRAYQSFNFNRIHTVCQEEL